MTISLLLIAYQSIPLFIVIFQPMAHGHHHHDIHGPSHPKKPKPPFKYPKPIFTNKFRANIEFGVWQNDIHASRMMIAIKTKSKQSFKEAIENISGKSVQWEVNLWRIFLVINCEMIGSSKILYKYTLLTNTGQNW